MLKDKRIVITGGAGFIGSHLVERLCDHDSLVVFDSLHRDALRFIDLARHPNVRLIQADVLDREQIREITEGRFARWRSVPSRTTTSRPSMTTCRLAGCALDTRGDHV